MLSDEIQIQSTDMDIKNDGNLLLQIILKLQFH